MTLRAEPLRRAAMALVAADVFLVAIYLADVGLGVPSRTLHRLVNLDAEGTVAAWYTSAKTLMAGVLFLLMAVPDAYNMRPMRSTPAGDPHPSASRAGPRGFLVLVGAALLLLSLDETVGLHELVTRSLRRFEFLPRFTGDHGMWVPFLLVGLAALLAGTAASWRGLWRHERHGTALLAAGVALGLAGAVGLEVVSYEVVRPAGARALYVIEVALEEGLELLGATAILAGSVRIFLRERWPFS